MIVPMNPRVASRYSRWTLLSAAAAALVGALVMMGFVISTYLERDVLRMRGLVLSFILLGLAWIVKSEAAVYVPVDRNHR